MADIKINGLTAAGSVTDAMQLETDTGGTTANKVTAAQIKTYVNTSPAVSGGTINNAVIGGTTPAAATFTTATATDVVTEDVQASGSAGVIIKNSGGTAVITAGAGGGTGVTAAGGVNVTGDLTVTGAAALNGGITMGGSEAMTSGRTLRSTSGSASTPSHSFSADTNTGAYRKAADQYAIAVGGTDALEINAAASAVNFLSLTNSATGADVTLATAGTDTDIDLAITPKGAGALVLDGLRWPTADGTSNQVLQTNGSGTLSFATVSGGGGGLDNYFALNATTLSLSSTAVFTVPFNDVRFNQNSVWNPGIASLAPGSTHAGKYFIIACVALEGTMAAATDDILVRLQNENGSINYYAGSAQWQPGVATTASQNVITVAGIFDLDGVTAGKISVSVGVNRSSGTSSASVRGGTNGSAVFGWRLGT